MFRPVYMFVCLALLMLQYMPFTRCYPTISLRHIFIMAYLGLLHAQLACFMPGKLPVPYTVFYPALLIVLTFINLWRVWIFCFRAVSYEH